MERSDTELITRTVEGDTRAFDALFARYGERVRRHLLRIVRGGAVADDLAQEVFLRVWTRAEQWQGKGSLLAWLCRIATNLALNHLRTVRRRKELPLDAPTEAEPSEEEEESPAPAWMVDASSLGADALLEVKERRERFQRLVDSLPEEQHEVMRMTLDAEMDLRSVADTLGIPEGTVKSRIHYAKKRLGQEWEDMENESEG